VIEVRHFNSLESVEGRAVIRCNHCQLVQFQAGNQCRKCRSVLVERREEKRPEYREPHRFGGHPPRSDEFWSPFCEALRTMRKALGMSQRKFARAVNCQRTYVSKYENGNVEITIGTLVRICGSLDIPPALICDLAADLAAERQQFAG
jgi:ribosome-binding protein aMBF1 (putative translation factor)